MSTEEKEEVKINKDDGIETLIMSETDKLSEIEENSKASKKKEEEEDELTRVEKELEKLKAEEDEDELTRVKKELEKLKAEEDEAADKKAKEAEDKIKKTEHAREKLKKHVSERNEFIHRMMMMLRYKYEYYEFWNLLINVVIILCSSVITFLESLRANITQDDDLDFWFTIITLSLGFIIAFSLSVFKFLKIQDKMEIIQSGILGLQAPYKEISQFYNEVETHWKLENIKKEEEDKNKNKDEDEDEDKNKNKNKDATIEIDEDFRNDKDVEKKWKKLIIKSVHPVTLADTIISSGEYYIYEKKYKESRQKIKKMQDKIDLETLANKNLKEAREVILGDMVRPTSELFNKFGPIETMKMANDIRLDYWGEGVIMSNNLQDKHDKILGIKSQDKCFNSCIDLYCCFCNSWCKKFYKSIGYCFICCRPRCCSNKDKRKHEWRRETEEEREEREEREGREEIV